SHFFNADNAVVAQETVDCILRNGGNRRFDWLNTNARLQAHCATGFTALRYGHFWLATDTNQADFIAGENQMGVFNLRVLIPNIWPLPRTVGVFLSNTP